MDFCLDGIQTPKVLTQSSTVVDPSPGSPAQHGFSYENGDSHSSVLVQDTLKDITQHQAHHVGKVVAVVGNRITDLPGCFRAPARRVNVFEDTDIRWDSEPRSEPAHSYRPVGQDHDPRLPLYPGGSQHQRFLALGQGPALDLSSYARIVRSVCYLPLQKLTPLAAVCNPRLWVSYG